MGKYNFRDYGKHLFDSENIEVEKCAVLFYIANELAEANRLKRVELKTLFKVEGYSRKELDDEA